MMILYNPYPYNYYKPGTAAAMIRDTYLKILFIPLLGVAIPAVSGIINYHNYSVLQNVTANFYFILISFCIWVGCNWIHSKVRSHYKVGGNPFIKMISLCGISAVYGVSLGGIFLMIWFFFSKETFHWAGFYKFSLFVSLSIVVFTLIYEILFLSKERELDSKIVYQ